MSTVILVTLVVVGCSQANGGERGDSQKTAASTRVDVGFSVPEYRGINLKGDSVSVANHRGHAVLLNIWGTWCIPCRVEVPVLQRLHQRYGPKGLDVIGVSVDPSGQEKNVHDFVSHFEVTYDIWLDPSSRVLQSFLVLGVPTTFLIGRDGVLLHKQLGPVPEGDPTMHRLIERALER